MSRDMEYDRDHPVLARARHFAEDVAAALVRAGDPPIKFVRDPHTRDALAALEARVADMSVKLSYLEGLAVGTVGRLDRLAKQGVIPPVHPPAHSN